jgi:hypothetical protein
MGVFESVSILEKFSGFIHNWCRWKGLGVERVLSIISVVLAIVAYASFKKVPKFLKI